MDDKLSSLEKQLLKRWQKHRGVIVTDAVKDELKIRFDGDVLFDEPMARHTYIKIGGVADVFLKPRTVDAALYALKLAREHDVPVHFHGWGANTLVKDGGVRGFVLCLYDALKGCEVVAETETYVDVAAEAGVSFANLARFARDLGAHSLTPLTGIPGSVGGMVAMNAGTREREMADVVRAVTVLNKDFEIETLSREKLDFEYRKLKLPRTSLILNALLRLERGKSREEIDEETKLYQKRRVDTQPLNFPNLGSIFKNPKQEGKSPVTAGMLVEESGLKDVRVGGARISTKHANFIVNEGGACARDVLALIDLARERVKAMHGIELETEIKIIGEDA